jgi:hypothetical protein
MLQLNDGGLLLFPPVVWKFKYDFDLDSLYPKIDNLFNQVEVNSKLEIGAAVSTVALPIQIQPHTWKELENFQFWLGEKISYIRNQLSFDFEHSQVVNSWANKHYKTGQTIEHSHSNTLFVVSAYIKCPVGSGNIEFKDPLEYHKQSFPIVSDDSFYREVPCETNDVLIFPGWVKHRTQASDVNDERIVITFNIK